MSNMDIPCGCDTRKYVMFTQGKLGVTEGGILALVLIAVLVAHHHGK